LCFLKGYKPRRAVAEGLDLIDEGTHLVAGRD
jgi:hypothetical protein